MDTSLESGRGRAHTETRVEGREGDALDTFNARPDPFQKRKVRSTSGSATQAGASLSGENVGAENKRELSSKEAEIGSDEQLEFAVESEIIPTLLQLLARETNAAATQRRDDPNPLQTTPRKAGQMTWVESLANTPSRSGTEAPVAATYQPDSHTSYTHASESPHWVTPEKFAEMVLDDREELAMHHFDQLRNDGVTDESLLLDLLAPTSVELGERWENDLSDFADVTVGVCRLHRILRNLHPQTDRSLDGSAHGGRVALVPASGEQHSFGLLLVGELLYRAGWYTDIDIDADAPHITASVARNWYEMVGISIGCETRVSQAAGLISEIRKQSCNPDVAIIVGGRAFMDNEQLGHEIGADEVITQGREVAEKTQQFIPVQMRI